MNWQHQDDALDFMRHRECAYLAMGMGTGKSKCAVDFVNEFEPEKVLILCPLSVVGVWRREFAKWGREQRVLTLEKGTCKKKAAEVARFLAQGPGVIVCHYDVAWRSPLAGELRKHEWCVIADEAHRIKSPSGKASRFARSLRTSRRICLSGTPLPHSPLDIWAQMRFLDPERFPEPYVQFRSRYAITDPMFPSKVRRWVNQDELQERLRPVMHVVRSEDVLDLPETMDIERPVELGSKALKAYRQLEEELAAEIDEGVITAANAMVRVLRLQQITSGVVTTEFGDAVTVDNSKQKALRELIEDLPTGSPVVVFGRFRSDLRQVAAVAEELGRSYGELSGERRDLTEHAEMPEGIEVMAVQIQSGGVGVDLTRAAYAVYLSPGLSLGDYLQSRARLHRPGQTQCVRFYHIVAAKTIDEVVYQALAKRRDVVEAILEEVRTCSAHWQRS